MHRRKRDNSGYCKLSIQASEFDVCFLCPKEAKNESSQRAPFLHEYSNTDTLPSSTRTRKLIYR